MPCIEATPRVTVCRTGILEIGRHIRHCPVCKRRRRMVAVHPDSPYYGATVYCVACGDSWTDGELHERPFQRGWRKKAISKARGYWDDAFTLTPEERAAWQRSWFPENGASPR